MKRRRPSGWGAMVVRSVWLPVAPVHHPIAVGSLPPQGGWTFAFVDYLESGVPAFFGTSYIERLAQAIDPINFKENLTMSKLVVDSTGDEFFQVQDDQVRRRAQPPASVPMAGGTLTRTDGRCTLLALRRRRPLLPPPPRRRRRGGASCPARRCG